MIRRAAGAAVGLLAAALLSPVARPAAADTPFNGIAVGTTVTALAGTLGFPLAVASEASGNRFVFPEGTIAYVDDDGRVLALAVTSGAARLAIDGRPETFAIGHYSVAQAERDLSADAEYATAALRSYRLEPQRDLVLAFDAKQRLERATYGEPGQLARLGLLPGDAAAKAVTYRPPQPVAPSFTATAQGSLTAVFRISIDRFGRVTDVGVAIPPVSAAQLQADSISPQVRRDRYTPALLDGKPIAATIFARVSFSAPAAK